MRCAIEQKIPQTLHRYTDAQRIEVTFIPIVRCNHVFLSRMLQSKEEGNGEVAEAEYHHYYIRTPSSLKRTGELHHRDLKSFKFTALQCHFGHRSPAP